MHLIFLSLFFMTPVTAMNLEPLDPVIKQTWFPEMVDTTVMPVPLQPVNPHLIAQLEQKAVHQFKREEKLRDLQSYVNELRAAEQCLTSDTIELKKKWKEFIDFQKKNRSIVRAFEGIANAIALNNPKFIHKEFPEIERAHIFAFLLHQAAKHNVYSHKIIARVTQLTPEEAAQHLKLEGTPLGFFNAGYLYNYLGSERKAISCFKQSKHPSAASALLEIYYRKFKDAYYEESPKTMLYAGNAIDAGERYLKFDNKDQTIHKILGALHHARNEHEEAFKHLYFVRKKISFEDDLLEKLIQDNSDKRNQ